MQDIQDVNGPCCMKVSQYSNKDYMKVSNFSTMVTWRFHIILQRLHEGFTLFYKDYM